MQVSTPDLLYALYEEQEHEKESNWIMFYR